MTLDALQEPWFVALRAEFNEALPNIISGGLDRTDLMKAVRRVNKGAITVGEIIGAVAAETDIAAAEITGARSTARVVRARRLAMCLACELIPVLTYDQIAGNFGRNLSTVPLALTAARRLLKEDPSFAHCYQHVRWRLGLA